MLGFDRIFRGLASGAAVAVLAGVMTPALAQPAPQTAALPPPPPRSTGTLIAPTLSRPVAAGVTWPKVPEIERRDGNGVSFYGGVATIDGSDQYGLSVLNFDPFQSRVRATYIDAWALNAPNAASCSLTFRAVERPLTQDQANALNPELATAEFETIKRDHPDLVRTGERTREGSGDTRVVDRFSWGGADGAGPRFDGLSKSWVFVRFGKAYYVNKICLSQTGIGDLTVMDQLIGLNYRTGDAPDPLPADQVPENPPAPRQLIYLPPPVGNIVARDQDRPQLESQTASGPEGEAAPAVRAPEPAPEPAPVETPPPAPGPVAPVAARPVAEPSRAPETSAPTRRTTPAARPAQSAPAQSAPAQPAPAATAPVLETPKAETPAIEAPAQPAFVASPTPVPAPPPAPTSDQSQARSLTRSLNGTPPAS